jgi:hypothetical protein
MSCPCGSSKKLLFDSLNDLSTQNGLPYYFKRVIPFPISTLTIVSIASGYLLEG